MDITQFAYTSAYFAGGNVLMLCFFREMIKYRKASHVVYSNLFEIYSEFLFKKQLAKENYEFQSLHRDWTNDLYFFVRDSFDSSPLSVLALLQISG